MKEPQIAPEKESTIKNINDFIPLKIYPTIIGCFNNLTIKQITVATNSMIPISINIDI